MTATLVNAMPVAPMAAGISPSGRKSSTKMPARRKGHCTQRTRHSPAMNANIEQPPRQHTREWLIALLIAFVLGFLFAWWLFHHHSFTQPLCPQPGRTADTAQNPTRRRREARRRRAWERQPDDGQWGRQRPQRRTTRRRGVSSQRRRARGRRRKRQRQDKRRRGFRRQRQDDRQRRIGCGQWRTGCAASGRWRRQRQRRSFFAARQRQRRRQPRGEYCARHRTREQTGRWQDGCRRRRWQDAAGRCSTDAIVAVERDRKSSAGTQPVSKTPGGALQLGPPMDNSGLGASKPADKVVAALDYRYDKSGLPHYPNAIKVASRTDAATAAATAGPIGKDYSITEIITETRPTLPLRGTTITCPPDGTNCKCRVRRRWTRRSRRPKLPRRTTIRSRDA